ncbi:MAG TPA: hypothetical protein VH951_00760 [Dehalococcoidia bacterium]
MIEKAFAINATPQAIWDALWADLGSGDDGSYELLGSNWPHSFSLRLSLAGLPCDLAYTIEPRGDASEVSASIQPRSWRYRLNYLLTIGHYKRNLEMILVISLSNLKKALEGEPAPESSAS